MYQAKYVPIIENQESLTTSQLNKIEQLLEKKFVFVEKEEAELLLFGLHLTKVSVTRLFSVFLGGRLPFKSLTACDAA